MRAVTRVTLSSDKQGSAAGGVLLSLGRMEQESIHQLLTTLRETRLELEALKRMFFEHRPPFVESFAQHRAAVEQSGYLKKLDEAIATVDRKVGV